MFSPKLRFSLVSGNRFSRNLGLRIFGYSLKKRLFITDSIIVKPSEKPIRALLSTRFIDVHFAFNQTIKEEIYNIIVKIDELPLRKGSSEMIPA